ncbi:MAG: hypothetical protein GY811_09030 [Myxococcales bacterium]|nr:hypothetical protein [Myxococcales bacterium]
MRSALFALALVVGFGCVVPTQSRFPADVATALREQPMRRLETDALLVYYPAQRRDEALRLASRIEGCAASLRSKVLIHSSYADQKMVVVMPDLPFNNAFVAPPALGSPPMSVIPTSNTLDFTTELGLPPDPSYVGCHEVVHYIQVLQVSGMWGWINQWFGDVLTPQIFLDLWFLEGLATYYESQLQPGTGRMSWPGWRGTFHAGFAEKRVNGGDLSAFQRPFHWGHHYLVGSHFVEFIAQRYGEKALWKVVQVQGNSILFPFGVALRWRSATGKTLPSLVDEFADHVAKHYGKRTKPAEQHSLRSAGSSARYTVAATGREALILSSGDLPTRLRIYDAGKLVRERNLQDVLPPYQLVVASPLLTSGLSFTGDGKTLYFVAIDQGDIRQEARLLRYQVASDEFEVVVDRLGGAGGGVNAEGTTYYYGRADGDRRHLSALNLRDKSTRTIREAEPRTYYENARPSADGTRIASAVFDGQRFVVRVLDAVSGETEAQLAFDGAVQDPSWIDADRLLLLAEFEGRFQTHIYDIPSGSLTRVSDAPYLAFQPRVHDKSIRFLNRVGWEWTLDEVPMPAPATTVTSVSSPSHSIGDPQTAPASREPHVISDEAYSQTDELFLPSLHTPMLFAPGEGAMLLGLQLSGGDVLSFHRWTVFGLYDLLGQNLSGGVHYSTALLAPIELSLQVDHFVWNEVLTDDDNMMEKGPMHRQERVQLSAGRSLRNSRIDFSLLGLEEGEPDHATPDLRKRRLGGPELSLSHVAIEGTPYAGARRGFALSGGAGYYDQSLSTLAFDLSDVSAALHLASPSPLSRRHTLGLSLRGRRLYGGARDEGFLEVGGGGGFAQLWRGSDSPEPAELQLGQPEPLLFFQEPLRGYEDLSFATDRIAIAELSYRYPIILDFGVSSIAYILPSLFFSQLDLQLFGMAATDSFVSFEEHRRMAAGASAELAMSFFIVPLRLRYQVAQRFTDDEALVHTIAIGN